MATTWVVRAGRGSESIDAFREHGVVAVGDKVLGSLARIAGKESMLALYAEKFPDVPEGTRATWASQSLRFVKEFKVGDSVATYDRDRRLYLLGEITTDYAWEPRLIPDKPHARHVTWTHQVARDTLTTAARNSLGAIQTLFKLSPEVADELREKQAPLDSVVTGDLKPAPEGGSESDESDVIRAETLEKADEFVEDAISRLDWKQMQDLVAGILRSMGYRTAVAAPGSDRGVDIFASPDGLGLQEPRIFVEVKHRPTTAMDAKEIRAFLGGRKPGDRCLYVSTGGFSKDANYEAERASVPTTLVNLPSLRRLLVEHYEQLDAEARALVPLKRLYWPVS